MAWLLSTDYVRELQVSGLVAWRTEIDMWCCVADDQHGADVMRKPLHMSSLF
jgi:hypothetical protein